MAQQITEAQKKIHDDFHAEILKVLITNFPKKPCVPISSYPAPVLAIGPYKPPPESKGRRESGSRRFLPGELTPQENDELKDFNAICTIVENTLGKKGAIFNDPDGFDFYIISPKQMSNSEMIQHMVEFKEHAKQVEFPKETVAGPAPPPA